MTATTLSLPAPARPAERPSLARLIGVELRKMVDTRAGLWLQLAVVALTVLVVLFVVLAGNAEDHVFRAMFWAALQPSAILLPVVGILLVASEWTQGTALITFTLVPERSRVLLAKLGAGTVLALGAFAVSAAIAAVGTAVAAPGLEGTWSLPAGLAGQEVVYVVTAMITGIGFGAVLLNTAPAIVLYFVLPIAWSAAGSLSFLRDAAGWLDSSRTLDLMGEELMSAGDWARAGATLAVWMLLPVLIGAWRIVTSEVRSS
jgi:ABC-2 type transport system permease protein